MANQISHEIYQRVTDTIIEALKKVESGEWKRPWSGVSGVPKSIDGHEYRGINALLLNLSGYASNTFGTFKAWKRHGANVKKGEKGIFVVLYKPLVKEEVNSKGEKEKHVIPIIRSFYVFAAEQTTYEIPAKEEGETFDTDKILEAYLTREGIEVKHGGNSAHWNPNGDFISMPNKENFRDCAAYQEVLAHECVHTTGYKTRLDRETVSKYFINREYRAKEELVAEFGSALFCAHAGIEHEIDENHVSYIRSWISALQNDTRLALKCAAAAQKGVDFILDRKNGKEETTDN